MVAEGIAMILTKRLKFDTFKYKRMFKKGI